MATKQSQSKKRTRKGHSKTPRSPADRKLLIEEQDEVGQPLAPNPHPASPSADVPMPQPPVPEDEIVPAVQGEDAMGLVDPRVLRPGPTA